MTNILSVLLLTLFGYTGLPTLFMRLGFSRTLKRNRTGRALVALTFDDGPDPDWTPRVLEILERQGVKACFFMLGSQAEAHPEQVRMVAAAGHEIGVHGYKHQVPAFLGFRSTMQEVSRTVKILTDITGKPPRLFRPPWGVFNLWSALAARRNGLLSVVWSVYVSEWSKSTTAASIYTEAMSHAHPGMVVLLHDAAGPGSRGDAPAVVANALPRLIAGLRRQGYRFVPLSQLLHPPEGGLAHVASDRSVGAHRP